VYVCVGVTKLEKIWLKYVLTSFFDVTLLVVVVVAVFFFFQIHSVKI
jgi:hypothetical protein